jgi:glycosyltransferase involved in cell wall biosynthesis
MHVKLTVIIPVYNEAETLARMLERVLAVPLELELLVVDDGSTDATPRILSASSGRPGIRLFRHPRNLGKGAAIRTALPYATGEAILIQDADLEYDPQDYPALLAPFIAGLAPVIYGRRCGPRHSLWRYRLGGRLLSLLADLLYRQRLTDIHCGTKLFDAALLKSLPLRCVGFEFCPEVTARIGKRGIRIHEVPIRYAPRTFAQGKKIRCRDGIVAAWTLFRVRFAD